MSHTPTLSQPPEAPTATPSRLPPAALTDAPLVVQETLRRTRTELAATTDRARQARLWMVLADLEERAGDEAGAGRDYLAAYNADPTFREPLEGLVRLLERRRSLKNLGKLVDALVRAASAPDEKVRALMMRAAYSAEVAGDLVGAKESALEATQVDGAPVAEQSSAWLALEVLAGRVGDPALRETALAERTKHAAQPAWRALLLLDRARMAATAGHVETAASLAEEARALGSTVTFAATSFLEQMARDATLAEAGADGPDALTRAQAHAAALEEVASLVERAAVDRAVGTAWASRDGRASLRASSTLGCGRRMCAYGSGSWTGQALSSTGRSPT
jgi:hypothetical protein